MNPQGAFQVRVLRTIADLRAISEEWDNLWHRCSDATPFQRPEWLLSWIEAFHPQILATIEVRLGNRLTGLAPFLIYRKQSDHVLALIGGGISDYLDVIVDPEHEAQTMSSIWDAVAILGEWTLVELTDLPADSAVLKTPTFQTAGREHDTCSALALPSTEDELLHLLSKRQRANLRNARSRAQKAGGCLIEVATPDTLSEFLDCLFQLHTVRWSRAGQSGVLRDEKVRTFHHHTAPLLMTRGILRLYRLCLGSRTLSVIYSLFERGTVFCYLQGFDPEFAYLSPGTQLMFAVLQDAVRLGMKKFDFLRGQEAYKQHWRAVSEPTYCVQVARSDFTDRTPIYARAA
jgi:CelD/BcsL family acetyltransferase involved in cellulose biosynthesis